MSQMKELYDKVAKDAALQMKFVKILENSDRLSEAEVGKKQVAFAKELGYDVTKNEIDEFFKDLSEKLANELSDNELDMVAGGKAGTGARMISAFSLGIGCPNTSGLAALTPSGCGLISQ